MKRFSKQELSKLRNDISIHLLISDILKIPSKTTHGRFRFLCPICSGFNTGIKLKTNLARCFQCEKNINTIEMVMHIRGFDFVNSATFLQHYLDIHGKKTTGSQFAPPSSTSPVIQNVSPLQSQPFDEQINKLSRAFSISSLNSPHRTTQNAEEERFVKLENKVKQLSKQLDQLKSFVISEFCQKSRNTI